MAFVQSRDVKYYRIGKDDVDGDFAEFTRKDPCAARSHLHVSDLCEVAFVIS